MFNKIRGELMAEDEPVNLLRGEVELDENSWGGRPRRKMDRKEGAAFGEANPTVLGMVARDGRVRARGPARRGEPLSEAVRANVNPESIHYTDDWLFYRPLRREYADHRVINRSVGTYVEGSIYTNTTEDFFGNLKAGMRDTYKKVSSKLLQSSLDEYARRYNNRRHDQRSMFHALVNGAAKQ
jgi:ISXO2-like transposase domain